MAHQPPDVLEVRGLKRSIAESVFFDQLSFSVRTGDVLFVRGPSGVGKSLLLRCLACLDDHQGGQLLLNGRSPDQLGYPAWRSSVTYVSQARISLKGTPAELYFQAGQFAAQKARTRERGDLPALVHDLGMEQVVLNQEWGELSGGQFQRMLLAIAVALRPSVLLLGESTGRVLRV